jgi:hypothetical protein
MIPSVVRIPMPVSHPTRTKSTPRISTRLPPQSTSRAMRRGTRPTGLCSFAHRGVNPPRPARVRRTDLWRSGRMRRDGRAALRRSNADPCPMGMCDPPAGSASS